MTSTIADRLVVPARYCGPPHSGNGGYVAGLLAEQLGPLPLDEGGGAAVQVTLREPPPLDVAMDLTHDGIPPAYDSVTLSFGGAVLAEARRTTDEVEALDPVDRAEATAASEAFPGLARHPFPTCFGCGTERPDGLRIFPGPVPGDDARVAAPWTPEADVSEDFHAYAEPQRRACVAATWAALDCTGGWAAGLLDRLMVLGRMTAILDDLPVVGDPHVVVGRTLGSEGRKTFTASTLYDPDGRIVGRARHVWVAIDGDRLRSS